MKKHIKTLFILLIVILTNNSCVELEEEPFGLIAPENFFKTEADFEKAQIGMFYLLTGCRSSFDSFYFNVLGYGSDDHEGTPKSSRLSEFNQLKVRSDNVYLRIIWGSICYANIANANAMIGNLGNIEGISEDKFNEFEGHARFIRAFHYFYLTRYFGEVPIIDENNSSKADQVGQSSVDLVYDFIIEDLKIAENKLALSYPEAGKITRGAAKTLLAKVYLTRACWPLKDASYYALARDKAKEVMDLGIYELEPVFADLWLTEYKLTLKESIFSLYSNAGNGGRRMQISLRPGSEGGWGDATSEARSFPIPVSRRFIRRPFPRPANTSPSLT